MKYAQSNGGLLDGYMTPAETASELGVCVRTIDRWHLLRKGPPRTRVGKKVLYKRSDVSAWISNNQEDSTKWVRRVRQ